ncbi:MAG: hypothetical protein JSV96_03700 [Candidatus Aminicenantes bacterium]|nr:MAG: hypothetical protein JSV96_03700 [Candidatus Aminicenantes bacterium]
MKDSICPICWNEYVRLICDAKVENKKNKRALMECDCCEKYYWQDTREIVSGISDFCETLRSEPEKCDESIRNAKMSSNSNHDKRKMEEFDLLCGFCSSRKLFLNNNSQS